MSASHRVGIERLVASSIVSDSSDGLMKNETTSSTSGGARGFTLNDKFAGSYSSTSRHIPTLDNVKSLLSDEICAVLTCLIKGFQTRHASVRII